jgi:hypothetical protein
VEGAHADVTGIGNNEVTNLKIGQGAAIVETVHDGPVIIIMSQYADLGRGKTIHSKGQLQHFGCIVDETSRQHGGRQCLITPEGYVIPLHIRDGLPRFDMRPPTDAEMNKYPHVFITSDAPWDPSVLDTEFDEQFHDAFMEDPEVQRRCDARDARIDDFGHLRTADAYSILFAAQDTFIRDNRARIVQEEREVFYDAQLTAVAYIDPYGYELPHANDEPISRFDENIWNLTAFLNQLRRMFPHTDALKPYLGWISNKKIKTMLDKTTQHFRGVVSYPFRKHYKSRFPGANVNRLNEWHAMDTFFSDTPDG